MSFALIKIFIAFAKNHLVLSFVIGDMGRGHEIFAHSVGNYREEFFFPWQDHQ